MQESWPKQSECDSFYGNPRASGGGASAKWELANLTKIAPPFKMTYARKPITGIRIHRLCAPSLSRILEKIWVFAGKNQGVIDESGMSIFDGSYVFRNMRGSSRLSMHAYGCAIDFDADRNGLGNPNPRFSRYPWVIEAFEEEGWVWGGRWSPKRKDGMHFQAARVA